MPELHRRTDLSRLRGFFHLMSEALMDLSPPSAEPGRGVLLTPGAGSETAFDQAFMATLLGFPLVESDDLTVREGRVYLRTTGRLAPVSVIYRRVDEDWSDPLELRPESQLGVPGLIEAVRRGTVSVANPIGAGVLENPGLLHFLPGIARAFLGEDLSLPSPTSFWCGDDTDRQHVLARIDSLILKPLSRGIGQTTHFGWDLSAAEQTTCVHRISSRAVELVRAGAGGDVDRAGRLVVGPRAAPDGAADLRGGPWRRVRGDARSPRPGGQRRGQLRRLDVRRSGRQGRVGPGRPGRARRRAAAGSTPWALPVRWSTPVPVSPPGSPRTCSGSAATPKGRREPAGCCAWPTTSARTMPRGRTPGAAALDALLHCRDTGHRPPADRPAARPGVWHLLDISRDLLRLLVLDCGDLGSVAFAVERLVGAAHEVRDQMSPDTSDGARPAGTPPRFAARHERDAAPAPAGPDPRSVRPCRVVQNRDIRDLTWAFLDAGIGSSDPGQVSLLRHTVAFERPPVMTDRSPSRSCWPPIRSITIVGAGGWHGTTSPSPACLALLLLDRRLPGR